MEKNNDVPKLCLNMIVKNESKVIRRLLQSVSTIIDYYCICDTGSTDDTKEIIREFFEQKNIPGKIVEEPFQDFGYNRTFSLNACNDLPVDYLMFLDADMILWKNPDLNIDDFKRSLKEHDYFYMYQGNDTFYYKNTRFVKNNAGFKYTGVTHEYVDAPHGTHNGQIPKDQLFIKDIGDGGSKANKFSRDVQLLRKGIEQDPNNDRYHFYLGNSLKDLGEKEEAIRMYKRRIELGGWIEEIWHSWYNMGHCYKEMGKHEMAINCWMEAYASFPNRVESLYEIIQYYRVVGKCRLAHTFYETAKQTMKEFPERDYLFMHKDVYDYKLDYELSIYGFYFNPMNYDLAQVSMDVMKYPYVDDNIGRNILSNYKFYTESLKDAPIVSMEKSILEQNHFREILNTVGKSLGLPSEKYPHYVSSSPSVCPHPKDAKQFLVMQRFVNYKINDEGGYDQQENIGTINVLAFLKQNKKNRAWYIDREQILTYDTSYDNLYVGLEDVRIMCHDHKLYYNSNRGLSYGNMVIEHGQIDLEAVKCTNECFPQIEDQREVEKNWVMFDNRKNELCMVYNWYPMIIGKIEGERTRKNKNEIVEPEFKETHRIETPYLFKYVRGSTNGIVIRDEVWFLCHIVSYEDRRYYYHILIAIDNISMELKKYTKLFTFEKEKVEYSLGMTYNERTNEFLFGYSKMDRETHYMTVHKSYFDERIIYL